MGSVAPPWGAGPASRIAGSVEAAGELHWATKSAQAPSELHCAMGSWLRAAACMEGQIARRRVRRQKSTSNGSRHGGERQGQSKTVLPRGPKAGASFRRKSGREEDTHFAMGVCRRSDQWGWCGQRAHRVSSAC
eukprot:3415670-Amphidinium_carterae.1